MFNFTIYWKLEKSIYIVRCRCYLIYSYYYLQENDIKYIINFTDEEKILFEEYIINPYEKGDKLEEIVVNPINKQIDENINLFINSKNKYRNTLYDDLRKILSEKRIFQKIRYIQVLSNYFRF